MCSTDRAAACPWPTTVDRFCWWSTLLQNAAIHLSTPTSNVCMRPTKSRVSPFGGQAPGSFDDIHGYCTDHYGITFPQFAKIDVNGSNASPLYVWLKEKKPGRIPWNFTKFVINRKGEVVSRFDAQTSTINAVENAVKAEL